jgi:hypothetical protein
MITKPRQSTADSLKKSLKEIRSCLSQSIPDFDQKSGIILEFSRIGTRYHIEKAPVPPTDKVGLRLEQSFNDFMRRLKVEYKGSKLEGRVMFGTHADTFIIDYDNLERTDKGIHKTSKAIDGLL